MHRSRTIHFVVSARDLPMKERGCVGPTVQDPYIKWSSKDLKEPLKQVSVTKHRKNEQNPDWYDTVFSFDWKESTGQAWRFEMMDYDVLSKDDVIGFVDVDVDNYVLGWNEALTVPLSCEGSLVIKKCEPAQFRLSAKDLPKLDPLNGLSDPYVKCYWSFGADGPLTLFHTTKTIKNVENAVWDEVIEFPNYQVGTKQHWTFKVFDKDPLPKDDAIGEASVDVDRFKMHRTPATFNLSTKEGNNAQLIVSPGNLVISK